ncbi:hypothetical protein SAMN05660816_06155 [Niastella yeongjuensis]|nr:hypothetical protein SAMN05660816_06155 [Niastella yeongjuensis]
MDNLKSYFDKYVHICQSGFSGKKSLGEHLKIFANSFKWLTLYLSRRFRLSTFDTKLSAIFRACDNAVWIIPLSSRISLTLLIMYMSNLVEWGLLSMQYFGCNQLL